MKKLELIPHWQLYFRFWSVRFALLGSALLTYLTAFPDAILNAWLILPPELKEFLPSHYMKGVVVIIFILSTFARIVKQPKVAEKIKEREAEKQAAATAEPTPPYSDPTS